MRILVFEAKTIGHCVGFAAGYASAFADAGCEVVFAVSASVCRPESPHRATLDALSNRVQTHGIDTEAIGYRGRAQGELEWQTLTPLIERVRPDRLVVPTADALGDALLSEKTSGLPDGLAADLVIHAVDAAIWPSGRRRFVQWSQGLLKLDRMRRIGRVMSCDPYPTLGPGAWPIRAGARRPPVFIAHPLPPISPLDRTAARNLLGWPNDRKLVVALGDIAKRRAAGALIAAAEQSDWPSDAMLVLAGICSDEARAAADTLTPAARDRVLIDDRYLDADEYAAAYQGADLIWAGSPHHRGMSATQWQAAAADRPAIVLDTHRCGRWLCDRIGPGAITSDDPNSIATCVANALPGNPTTKTQISYLKQLTNINSFKKVLLNSPE